MAIRFLVMYTQLYRYVGMQLVQEIIVHLVTVFILYVQALCRGTLEMAGGNTVIGMCGPSVVVTLHTERSA